MTPFRNWPLNTKLLALVVASSVPPVLVASWAAAENGRELIAVEGATVLAASAEHLADELDAFTDQWLAVARAVAVSPSATAAVGPSDAWGGWASVATRYFEALARDDDRVRLITLVRLDGTVVASSDSKALGVNVAGQVTFREGIAGRPVRARFVTSPNGRPDERLLAFAVPVRDEASNVIGVVEVDVRAELLSDVVRHQSDRSWTGSYAVVLDEFGIRLAHGKSPALAFHPTRPLTETERAPMVAERRFGEQTRALLETVTPVDYRPALALLDQSGSASVAELGVPVAGDGPHLGVARRMKAMPWTAIELVPKSSFNAPVDALARVAVPRALVAAVFGGMLVLLLMRAITGPLFDLIRASTELGNGRTPAPIVIDRTDELGQLAMRFNELSEAVTLKRADLEDKVRLRTAELSMANAELRTQQDELQATSTELMTLTSSLADQSRLLHQRNREIERASELKSAFLANMSHELRTPLNSIIGFSELLRDELFSTLAPRHRKYLEDVRGAGHHLLMLINDILDLSKIEAGHLELELHPLSPQDAVGEVAGLLRVSASKKEQRLEVGPHSHRTVRADAHRVRQILLNLLANAVKFSPPGATVSLGSEDVGDSVRFWVRDTGPGIDPAVLPRLFEPFVQGDHPMIKRHQGTGLGLAISRRLARLHGSELQVESTLGEGSTFSFHVKAVGSALLSAGPSGARPVVFLVEHDEALERLLRGHLAANGYEVAAPLEGETPLATAKRVGARIAVIDPTNGDELGMQALRELQEDSSPNPVPVVLTVAPRAAAVLGKPPRPSMLLAATRRTSLDRPPEEVSILVVDDEATSRTLVAAILRKGGYQVVAVESAVAAHAALAVKLPDVIFTDLMMPETSGFDFIDQLSASAPTRAVPVIVLTAFALTTEQRARLARRVFATSQKGDLTAGEVLAAVDHAVRRGEVRQERSGAKILVVDDHDLNRELVRAFLEPLGYVVVEANGGEAGLAGARADHPDLILMDLAMPGMDGFSALASLRADPALRSIPVLALTALAMRADENRVRAAGFDDYLTKPIEQVKLRDALARHLKPAR